ncbi:restriction endonuclease subunit S [Vibrio parahaemolyticus]|uniref:restriction endonuclease subunit S n=1 Tax=Vibrio parahaemolyticus TaxID=670 RepID=UPI00041B444B|nr:restriction endonuclease subunit S [Vibrio parahaemolyticus]MCG7758440.1 restriction endonuclease subunit S [Vibrio parahaemolyticus]HCH0839675.1 restriction endonuclease subunit S [Vibrio parahaemolyticus]HCH2846368.1 restriction endonuclease subunit S [Vibrio parahaemolyticus]HCH5260346.1 restriction endonuclease subunit S [Vibrio parahaemolyticus]HCH6062012.1 restriction endonuclease subunit S [Vibrio parahaemolyticus]
MSCNTTSYVLGDLVELSQGLAINVKTKHVLSESGLPLLRIADLISRQYCQFVNPELAPKKCLAVKGDLIYTRTGQVGLVFRDQAGVIHNNSFKVIPDESKVRKDFLYWFLSQNKIKALANDIASGSVQKDLNHSAFKSIAIELPDFDAQDRAIKTLDSIDQKITLNTQTNQTLEQMAQAIFKSWFVDFDPVKAKMKGEQPEGMDAATVSLFPDKLVESELGLIPEGWDIATIKDFGSVVCGKTPSKKNADFYGGDVPFIKIPDTHGKVFITETTDTLTQAGDESQPKKRIPENSICVSCIATVGQVFITTKPSHTNQQINSVVPHDANSLYYLLFKFKGLNKHFHDLASGGSATLNMNTRTFSNVELVRPTADVMEAFHNTIGGLMQKMLTNQLENATLAELRDTLLPKLLSGEIELGQAQELAEVE